MRRRSFLKMIAVAVASPSVLMTVPASSVHLMPFPKGYTLIELAKRTNYDSICQMADVLSEENLLLKDLPLC